MAAAGLLAPNNGSACAETVLAITAVHMPEPRGLRLLSVLAHAHHTPPAAPEPIARQRALDQARALLPRPDLREDVEAGPCAMLERDASFHLFHERGRAPVELAQAAVRPRVSVLAWCNQDVAFALLASAQQVRVAVDALQIAKQPPCTI
eukprot:2779866-Rhodomonas_salina.8